MTRKSVITLILTFVVAAAIVGPAGCSTTGIISGTVTDLATGDALAGVNIIIEGTNLTTVTDKNGYYVVTNVPPGEYKVTAGLVGYSDLQIAKVNVLMDMTASADCQMSAAVENEETVIVKESRPMIRRDSIPTSYIVDQAQEQMVRAQPTNMYQTPALVLTQPGVIADEGGYPHIRGGRANEIAYLIDGIPVTETVTNGFGTNIVTVGLDKMEMFTGGYRPEYGNAVSGVFNQVIKTGKTAPGANLEIIGGSDSFQGTYPQIGGSGQKFDYYMGGYLWRSEFTGLDYNEVDSFDYIGKFNYDLDTKNKLTMLTGSGEAKYQFPTTHTQSYGPGGYEDVATERDFSRQAYSLNALTWTHRLNSAAFITVRPYLFSNEWHLDALHPGMGMWWDAASSTKGLLADYTNQLSEKHLLKAGVTRMSSNNRYWVNVPDYGNYEYTADTDTLQSGMYIQDQVKLNSKWRVEGGLRYDRMAYDKVLHEDKTESQWSPRFGISYAADSKTNLRFSYGKMIQFANTQALERIYTDPSWAEYYGLENSDLAPERSTQYDIGWERQVSNDYSVQVTPFYRKMTNMMQYRSLIFGEAYPIVFDNLGDGSSTGIEFMVKKRASKNWSGWLSYTYSTAKAESSSAQSMVTNGVTQYVDWDQRHTAAMVLNYNQKDWNYSLLGEYGSGLPWTGLVLGVDDYGQPGMVPEPTPNTHRVSPHFVLSLNITRDVKGGWLPAGQLRFGVANLLNTGKALDRDYDGSATVRVPPRFINVSYVRRW